MARIDEGPGPLPRIVPLKDGLRYEIAVRVRGVPGELRITVSDATTHTTVAIAGTAARNMTSGEGTG